MKKLVVITGASSGFGKALAYEFNREGYPLLLLARRIELLEEMKLSNTICRKVDVADKESFETAIREAEEIYGKTDLIVNNAGVMLLGNIESQDCNEWKNMLDTNVLGVINGMQIVMNDMIARQSGTIINVSSVAGVSAFRNHAVYSATKYGVVGLTEVARMEMAQHNVRVMSICPGAVKTELLGHTTSEEIKSNYSKWQEEDGVTSITAQDVAKTIKFAYELPQGVCLKQIQIVDTKQS